MKQVSEQTRFARLLRKNQTDAEKVLWSQLRRKQLNGIKFRRQQVIGKYIVDFVSFEKKLIIEVDGSPHNTQDGKRNDIIREELLKANGFVIMRFWNSEIMKDVDMCLECIKQSLTWRKAPSSPKMGEEKEKKFYDIF